MLFELSMNAGRVSTFDALLERVWSPGHPGERGSVRTYVKRLRRKLGEDADSPEVHLRRAPRRLPHAEGRTTIRRAARRCLSGFPHLHAGAGRDG